MTYTYIKTHNLIEFYAVKNGLEERGMIYLGVNQSRGTNIIKIDHLGMFGMGTYDLNEF